MLKKQKTKYAVRSTMYIFAILALYLLFSIIMTGCEGPGGGGTGGGTYTPGPVLTPEGGPVEESARYAYVSARSDAVIDVYNAETFEFVRKMEGVSMPNVMCFSRATKRTGDKPRYLYVANNTNVKRFDLKTQTLDNTWGTGVVSGIAIRDVDIKNDDSRLYSPDAGGRVVIVTNVNTKQEVTRINPGPNAYPDYNSITSDGRYEITPYLGWSAPYGIPIIRTDTNTVWNTAWTSLGIPSGGIAIDPTNTYAYICSYVNAKVLIMNINTAEVVGSVNVGDRTSGIVLTLDGTRAYVTNTGDNTVSVLEVNGQNVTELPGRIPVGAAPWFPGISSDGQYVWVPCGGSDKVYVIRTSDNTVVKILDTDYEPVNVLVE